MKKRIAILGSTGSIGTQALEVIDQHPDKFQLELLSAKNNSDLLIAQARKYQPNVVVIGNDDLYDQVNNALDPMDIKVYAGKQTINQVVDMDSIDLVLVALVGFAAVQPTLNAIRAKKQIALANKECLVVAGEIITREAIKNNVDLIPVDSEHSAIFQCLTGEHPNTIEEIYLTASGGPFRKFTSKQLQSVKKADALQHPNWNMGDKITIDSATMMNKGLEVIEARWLFGLKPEQIKIIVHPQSIIHSIVQFVDGSMKAQMSLPDMRMPIQYAFAYPARINSSFPRLNFTDYQSLTFRQPDMQKFRNLALAFKALRSGGNLPCILNAANEIAVDAFLHDKIGFLQMPDIIEKCMTDLAYIAKPTLDDLYLSDDQARKESKKIIENINHLGD